MDGQVKLKPCPFCGGKAEAEGQIVYCTCCGAMVSGDGMAEFARAEAIMKWNRREGECK